VTIVMVTAVTIDVLANDFDPDCERIKLESVTSPRCGTAEITEEQKILYTPRANFAADRSAARSDGKSDRMLSATLSTTNTPPSISDATSAPAQNSSSASAVNTWPTVSPVPGWSAPSTPIRPTSSPTSNRKLNYGPTPRAAFSNWNPLPPTASFSLARVLPGPNPCRSFPITIKWLKTPSRWFRRFERCWVKFSHESNHR